MASLLNVVSGMGSRSMLIAEWAIFAAASAISFPVIPTWLGTHCKWISHLSFKRLLSIF